MELIESSAWRQGAGERPSRIVLHNVGGWQPFATHIEVQAEDGSCFCVAGHYFKGSTAATYDFQKRVAAEASRYIFSDVS